jgi:hypothetical protein
MNERVIKHKIGLLNLAVEVGGVKALLDKLRRKPNLKNRVDDVTEQAVLQYAIDFPAHGQTRTSNELRKLGTFISPSGVRGIWLGHKLACFKDRLKALEAKVANEGIILTEAQVAALERKKHDDLACGEIETAHIPAIWDLKIRSSSSTNCLCCVF